MLTEMFGVAGAALLASVALVAATRAWARRRMVLDHPNDRSLHQHPTPRGGGIGIVIPICLALAGVAAMVPESSVAAGCLVGGGLVIAAVGLADDVRGLPPLIRLAAQGFAAMLVIAGVDTWRTLMWPGSYSFELGWAAIPFTVLWVVGLTNAYNFMDGIDGIAGIQALAAGVGWVAAGYLIRDPMLTVIGLVIASASLGFLFFNWSPASIFMGDVGSAFLGFVLAALTVLASPQSPTAATAGALFVWPFVFDSSLTLMRRASRRENLLRAHRSHLYQRLVLTGMPHATVALIYGALAGVGVAVGMSVVREDIPASVGGAVLIGLLAGGLWVVVIWRERAARPEVTTTLPS